LPVIEIDILYYRDIIFDGRVPYAGDIMFDGRVPYAGDVSFPSGNNNK